MPKHLDFYTNIHKTPSRITAMASIAPSLSICPSAYHHAISYLHALLYAAPLSFLPINWCMDKEGCKFRGRNMRYFRRKDPVILSHFQKDSVHFPHHSPSHVHHTTRLYTSSASFLDYQVNIICVVP